MHPVVPQPVGHWLRQRGLATSRGFEVEAEVFVIVLASPRRQARLPVERNAVSPNPIARVKRPRGNSNKGKTPAPGVQQTCALVDAPVADTLYA
ncbi:hypothetical protein PSAC2689_100085 [Paraburkholderia sacchari]